MAIIDKDTRMTVATRLAKPQLQRTDGLVTGEVE